MSEMNTTPPATQSEIIPAPPGSDSAGTVPWVGKGGIALALIGLAVLIFIVRLHTYREPLERDLTTYAVIAHEMLGGKALYSDLWDHKPPAIHVTYAAAELMAGYGRNSIFLMGVSAAILTMVACYFAGCTVGGGALGGLIAAMLWAVVSGDLSMEANQPNTEVFINLFLTIAFAILVRSQKRSLGLGGALLVGTCFALASLYKQIAVLEAAALASVYLLWPPAGNRRNAFAEIALMAAVGAITWAAVFAYFFIQHRGGAFVDATITYNHYYAGNIWHNLDRALRLPPLAPEALGLMAPLVVLCLTGLFFAIRQGAVRPWIFLAALALATHIAVLLPGQFFPHYYQLWLPLLVIGSGGTIAMLQRVLPTRSAWLSYAAAAVTLLIVVKLEFSNYQIPPQGWSIRKYGPVFWESDQLADQLNRLLQPRENFYEWGDETGLYFATRHEPPSGIFFAEPLLAGPLRNQLRQRLFADLNEAKPDIFIVEYETLKRTRPSDPMLSWVKQNYHALARTSRFLVLARKGSRLERQQAAKHAATRARAAGS
jgi:hypothetical protein